MAVGKMDQPTGPTGILKSNRPQQKAGGYRSMGSTKGITSSPGREMVGRKLPGRTTSRKMSR